MNETLQTLLDIDRTASLATRGFFGNYPVEHFHIKNNSALIFGSSDHRWIHCLGNDPHDLEWLLNIFHVLSPYYYSVEEWMLPLILKYREADWIMETLRYVLDPEVPVSKPYLDTRPLKPSLAFDIYSRSGYRELTDPDYIRDRLTRDVSAGIWKGDELVAWGLTHDDGALGFLHVLPDHRRKGYARDIVLARIAMKRVEDRPVFCNIVPHNTPAKKLMDSLGFRFDRKAYWIKLKDH